MLHYGQMPVAYVTPWSNEREGYIDNCDEIPGRRAFHHNSDQGQGRPDFRGIHASRQRECVTRRICQICGKRIGLNVKPIAIAPFGFTITIVAGQAYLAQTEPLMHKRCAKLAAKWCPHLQRALASDDAAVAEVLAYYIEPANFDQIAASRPDVPQGNLKLPLDVVFAVTYVLTAWTMRDLAWLEAN